MELIPNTPHGPFLYKNDMEYIPRSPRGVRYKQVKTRNVPSIVKDLHLWINYGVLAHRTQTCQYDDDKGRKWSYAFIAHPVYKDKRIGPWLRAKIE